MIRTVLITATALTAIALTAPAQADTAKFVTRNHGAVTLQVDANACQRELAKSACSTFQSRLLASTVKGSNAQVRATLREVGRQQLDALIASFD